MPVCSVKGDKLEALRRALGQRGHYGDKNIAQASGASASSVRRILAGERVSVTKLRQVFACSTSPTPGRHQTKPHNWTASCASIAGKA